MEEIVYLNGCLTPLQEAKVSAMDYGFLYGYGLFETMRAYQGVVFRLDSHLKRLAAAAKLLEISIDTVLLRKAVAEVIQANKLHSARIRLAVSLGEGSLVPDLRSCRQPTTFIAAAAHVPYEPEKYDKGYHIIVSDIRRASRSPLPLLKTANYLENLLSRQEARSAGGDDALLLNENNLVSETSASNIFIGVKNILKTPCLKTGLLPGITREVVLELAAQHGIEVLETDILLEELTSADEIFLTNSIMEIMPVTAVNDKRVATGKPGLVTREIMKLYSDAVNSEIITQAL